LFHFDHTTFVWNIFAKYLSFWDIWPNCLNRIPCMQNGFKNKYMWTYKNLHLFDQTKIQKKITQRFFFLIFSAYFCNSRKHIVLRKNNTASLWILIIPAHRVTHGNILTKVWHDASSISNPSYHDVITGDNPDRAMHRRYMQSQIFMRHSRGSTELQSAGLNCNRS